MPAGDGAPCDPCREKQHSLLQKETLNQGTASPRDVMPGSLTAAPPP